MEALDAIHAIRAPERELVFPISKPTLWEYVRRLIMQAGVNKGSPKWFRRSSATAVEMISPGAAMSHLGHKTPGLAYKHYVDPRQVQTQKTPAPPIAVVPPPAIKRAPQGVPELSPSRSAALKKERMTSAEFAELLRYLKKLGHRRDAIEARLGYAEGYLNSVASGARRVTVKVRDELRRMFGLPAWEGGAS